MEKNKKTSLIDRLKQWWKQRNKNIRALEAGQPEIEYQELKKDFDQRCKVEGNSPTLFKKGNLDYALDQYLSGLLFQGQTGQKYSSYRTLIDLGGISNGIPGNNPNNENNLINYLKDREDMSINRQCDSKTGNVFFYHIRKNYNVNSNITKRLYLNCNRENIALLAGSLIKNMDDMDRYYFKFNSDWQASNKNRSEQFVFYIEDDKQLNDVMQRIEKTKQEHPKLFEGDENINPFLKNINGMAYANEPKASGNSGYTTYVDLANRTKNVRKSYNSLLSTALEDSLVAGINNMILNNNYLGKDLTDEELNNPEVYARKILPRILEDGSKKMQLIQNMQNSLVELSKKNSTLDIQGIDKAKQKQNQTKKITNDLRKRIKIQKNTIFP